MKTNEAMVSARLELRSALATLGEIPPLDAAELTDDEYRDLAAAKHNVAQAIRYLNNIQAKRESRGVK